MRYFDKDNNEIIAGMRIIHNDGDIETVYQCSDEDLGVSADNPNYTFIDNLTPSCYPLSQFNMSEWKILEI